MINITDKKLCSGCSACANICPKKCITMTSDNEGFLYPTVDEKLCVQCGLCDKTCPINNPIEEKPFEQDAFVLQHKSENVRVESTAGGAFTAIAEIILNKGGIVFGAAYDKNLNVYHCSADTVDGIQKFRRSKYVQSDLKNTFSEAKKYLDEGKYVCYSGTPCQIEGLNSFLGKNYEKLFLVDVACHSVPSPLIWKKYIEYHKDKFGDKVDKIEFRDKHYGYKYSTMTVKDKDNKKLYHIGSETDPMMRAFLSDMAVRPACYDCRFKKRYRVSDVTIWDCYNVYDFDKKMDDDKGTTRVLVQTDKGRQMMSEIENSGSVRMTKVSPDELVKNVKEMFNSVKINPRREQFFADAQKMNGTMLFAKYYPVNAKIKLKRIVRITMNSVGVYALIKKLYKKIKN